MDIQKPQSLKIAKVLMILQLIGGVTAGVIAYFIFLGTGPVFIYDFVEIFFIPTQIVTVGLVFISLITTVSSLVSLYAIENPSVGSWRLSIIFLILHLFTSISIFSVVVLVILLGQDIKKYFYQSEAEAHFYESKGPFR